MNSRWHIIFCDAKKKDCPISRFIDSRKLKHQVKIIRFLQLLEERGPNLARPYADLLEDGIHELRIKLSGDQVRFLYFFSFEKFIILYNGFIKNTDRVPSKYINEIKLYRADLLDRIDKDYLEKVTDENV